jgi:long-chain fatty acid transport protein
MKTMNRNLLATTVAALLVAPAAFATNGMNMEGYGPVSTAMGGTAQAYNNGLGAMMNNPATLGLGCDKDCTKLSVGVGFLQPSVETNQLTGSNLSSDGTRYTMPAMGYATNKGSLAYGIGIMAQGGMGTKFNMGNGSEMMSELSVGRIILPIAMQVNPNLRVGASLDFIWAGMDLKMMGPNGQGVPNQATGANMMSLSAANSDDYSGQMKSTGWAGKIGLVYKLNDKFSIGASYHTKTTLGDLTGSGTMVGALNAPAASTYTGDIKVVDFQWPETIAAGVAYKPTQDWLLAFDVKKIMWSNTMKVITINAGTSNIPMTQNWDDQTVVMLGAAYDLNKNVTLRAGYNKAANPIPDSTVHPLFPAIIESHFTAGIGYKINDSHSLDASIAYAPEVSQTGTTAAGPLNGYQGNTGTVSHSQTNIQMLYTYSF